MGMIPVSAASTGHAGAQGRLDPLPTYRTEGDTSSSGDLAQMLLREQREATQQGSGPPGHRAGRESAHQRLHPGAPLPTPRSHRRPGRGSSQGRPHGSSVCPHTQAHRRLSRAGPQSTLACPELPWLGGGGWEWHQERQTVSQLLHVIVEHGLLQGRLVVGADGVRVGVGAVVPRPWPREGTRGLGVEEGGLVVQSRPASFHCVAAAPALSGGGGDATIAGHLGHSTLLVPFRCLSQTLPLNLQNY